jgi:cellulose 1,4-beta-cellobiosidase
MQAVRSKRRRLAITGLAAGALMAGTLGIVSANHASANPGCEVTYNVVNNWGSGFQANVTIKAGQAIDGWTIGWTFPSGTSVSSAWNVNHSVSGSTFTGRDVGWNASIPAGQSREVFGFIGSGSATAPAQFTVNGVVCDGTGGGTPTTGPTTPTTGPTTPGGGGPGNRVDNPYQGADVYVNPIWSANAASEPGGSRIANLPTAVWLDQTSAIWGNNSPTTGSMGLEDHLDEALNQLATAPSGELVFQFVVYNLPGRDCAALASNGQLAPHEIDKYKTEYIDEIANIIDQDKYSDLRIVAVIEVDSLPNLVTNVTPRATAVPECDVMKDNENYQNGVAYAVAQLGAIGNVYNYVDIGHHGWIGWTDDNPEYDNFRAAARVFASILGREGATKDHVAGFISNTANFSVLEEPYWSVNDTVGGIPVRDGDRGSKWVDWNVYNGEVAFVQNMRQELIRNGFDQGIGMLIDTSRNGWGGPNRPTGTSTSTNASTYVDESRIDRRYNKGNWCNQAGAGLGVRPTTAPAAGIDAYVWIKPPGESDGSSSLIPNPEGKGFDEMCDPNYPGNIRNNNNPSGARGNMPISGHWSSEQFQELMQNAWPPLN